MSMTFATDVIISSTTSPVKSLSTTKLLVPDGANSTTISLGSAGQVLTTDGSNKVYWADDAGIVSQNQLNVNSGEYPLLLKHSASDTAEIDTVNFSTVKYSVSEQGLVLCGDSIIRNSNINLDNANNRTNANLTGSDITTIQRISFCAPEQGASYGYAQLTGGVAYESSQGNYVYTALRVLSKDTSSSPQWNDIGYLTIRQYKNKQVRAYLTNNNSGITTSFYVNGSGGVYNGVRNTVAGVNLAFAFEESTGYTKHGIWSSGYYNGTSTSNSQRWLIFRNSDNQTWIGSSVWSSGIYYVSSTNTNGFEHRRTDKAGISIYTHISDAGLIGMRSNGYYDGTDKKGSSAWFFYRDNSNTNIFNGVASGCLPLDGGTLTGYIKFNKCNIHFCSNGLTKGTAPSENSNSNGIFIHDQSGTLDANHRICTFYGYVYTSKIVQARMLAYAWTASSGTHSYFGMGYDTANSKKRTYTDGVIYGAVWNDYAEYRKGDITEGGYCVTETSSGVMTKSTKRLQPACRLTSDTFGFAIGETKDYQTPIAVSGRVLVYTYRPRDEYPLGAAVCSAPDGKVDLMTREEIMMYPERILGTVSEIPTYDVWEAGHDGTGDPNEDPPQKIPVNGRIWIYVK